jgi:feruloyl esterase
MAESITRLGFRGAWCALALAIAGLAQAQPLAPARPGAFTGDCASLTAALAGLADTRITSTTTVASGALRIGGTPVPEHCLVTGRMRERTSAVDGQPYAIGFEMRLPKAWNGRFLHQGNGGSDGNVVPAVGSTGGGPVTHALLQGFAVLSSDAGHTAAQNLSFGLDPQARLDYGYQAVETLTPMAKSTVQRVYGRGPDRSYFAGCSNGGRHTLIAASR